MFISKSTWCLFFGKKIAAVSRRFCDRQLELLYGPEGRVTAGCLSVRAQRGYALGCAVFTSHLVQENTI